MASLAGPGNGASDAAGRKERAPSPPPSSGAGSSQPVELPHDPRRLYVFGLPETVKESDLTEIFSRYGKIHIMRIIYDHLTGKTKGYAFVTMETEAMGQEIIRQAQQGALQLEGRPLRVEQARGRSDRNRDDHHRSYDRRYSPQRRMSPRRDDDRRPPRDAYDDRRDRYDDRYRRDDYRGGYPAGGSSGGMPGYSSRSAYYPPPAPYPADPYYRDRYAAPPPPSSYARDARDPYPPRDPRDYRDPYPAAPARTSYPPPSSSAYGPSSSYPPPPPPPQAGYYDSRYDYGRRQDDPRRDMPRDDRRAPPPPVGARPPPYPERYDDRRK